MFLPIPKLFFLKHALVFDISGCQGRFALKKDIWRWYPNCMADFIKSTLHPASKWVGSLDVIITCVCMTLSHLVYMCVSICVCVWVSVYVEIIVLNVNNTVVKAVE